MRLPHDSSLMRRLRIPRYHDPPAVARATLPHDSFGMRALLLLRYLMLVKSVMLVVLLVINVGFLRFVQS